MPDKETLTDEGAVSQHLLDELAEARERVAELESAVLREASRAQGKAIEQVQRELRIKEAMVDGSVAGLALWDLEGTLSYVNPAFLAMWGYSDLAEVQGRTIQDLMAGDPRAEAISSSVEQLGGWIGKLNAMAKDGSPFTVMLSVSLVREPDGAPSCAVGSFVEMTYRERLNTMLFQQADWLRAAHEIDRGILSGTDLTEIGKSTLEHIRELVPCACSSVTLFDLDESQAELLAAVPDRDETKGSEESRDTLAGFERTLKMLHAEEICAFDPADCPPLPEAALGLGEKLEPDKYVIVPLRCRGELLGSVNLALHTPESLDKVHESILRQLADSLAVAVRTAQITTPAADSPDGSATGRGNVAGEHDPT